MSLWYKQINAITFGDVDQFCVSKIPEGLRLDYKREIPNDLAKIVAAFANTLGGLIVLGVDADKTTNTPMWPPTTGMRKEAGLESASRPYAATTSIRPSARRSAPSSTIRTSPERPLRSSASTKARKLRTPSRDWSTSEPGSQGTPYQHSNIDRISHLLGRAAGSKNSGSTSFRMSSSERRGNWPKSALCSAQTPGWSQLPPTRCSPGDCRSAGPRSSRSTHGGTYPHPSFATTTG